MSNFFSLLRFFWCLYIFVIPAFGENTPKLFQWGFKDEALPSTLPTCNTFPIVVKSFDPTTNATNGVPPYYMISFPIGGTPQTTLIGSDENNLMWTVTQPVGSTLLLSVVDSQQNPGGVPGQLVTVIPGQTTQCVTTPINAPAFTVSANVSQTIETCVPWGITVVGGSPPYTITLAETNSPVVTNVTMPFGTDRFTFINRAVPNGKLIAAISDLEGRWATGTSVVQPVGSSNVDCIGLVSSSGNNTLVNEEDAQIDAAATVAKRTRMVIMVVVVVFVVLLLLGIGGAVFWKFRKHKQKAQEKVNAALPTQFPQSEPSETGSEPTVGTGRWQIGSDEKRAIRRGDVEAPPYQEMVEVSAGPVASGSGSRSGPSRSGIQAQPQTTVGSSTLLRAQLPRLQMPGTPMNRQLTPEPRSVDSTTALIASAATNGSISPPESSQSSKRASPQRAASSRFVNFPTKPIRKNSGVALDITPVVSKAPSAFRNGAGGTSGSKSSRYATHPNSITEDDRVVNDDASYYQDSADGVSLQESGLPRYRSLTRRER